MKSFVELNEVLKEECDVSLSDTDITALENYYREVLSWNKKLNLTRLTAIESFLEANLLDALYPLMFFRKYLKKKCLILDLGTGCGSPGIPLMQVLSPEKTYLVDSSQKKAKAVGEIVKSLGLSDCEVLPCRGNEIKSRYGKIPGTVDLITARAVGKMDAIVHEVGSLLAGGGLLVFYKGPGTTDEEIAEAQKKGGKFKLELISKEDYNLPSGEKPARRIFIFKKSR